MKLALLFAIIVITGCSGGGGGSSTTPPPPDVSVLADYNKLWVFVANGDLHSTVHFNAVGVMDSDSVNSFYDGSLVKTGNLTCHITEHFTAIPPGSSIYQEVHFSYDGSISSDRNSMFGTFTWVADAVPGIEPAYSGSGNWCATASGLPYLTNANFTGTWDITDDQGGTALQFDSHGVLAVTSFVESGTLILTGGTGFAVQYSVHGPDLHGNTVNIQTTMRGTLATTMVGTLISDYGSYRHSSPFTGTLRPSGGG